MRRIPFLSVKPLTVRPAAGDAVAAPGEEPPGAAGDAMGDELTAADEAPGDGGAVEEEGKAVGEAGGVGEFDAADEGAASGFADGPPPGADFGWQADANSEARMRSKRPARIRFLKLVMA